jgi:hypothetical protein
MKIKFCFLFILSFCIHILYGNNIDYTIQKVKQNCKNIEVFVFKNKQATQIPIEYKEKLLSVVKNESIQPTDKDYEVAKIDFICEQDAPLAIFVFYSPVYKLFYFSIENPSSSKYFKIDQKTYDMLKPFLG